MSTVSPARIFAEYARSTPGISVEVLSVHGYPSLLSEGLDLAFLVRHQTSMPDSTQWARRIGTFPRRLFASKQYLRRKGVPRKPPELVDRDCILFSFRTLQKRWGVRRGGERSTIDVSGSCSANSVGLLGQFARESPGIAILPVFLAQHPAHGGGLI